MNEELKQRIQERIRELINLKPGLHLSKIAELLNIPVSEVEHHLKLMENDNIITPREIDGYTRYYPGSPDTSISEDEVQETWKRVYNIISENPGLHLSKIAELLDMSKPLAEYHLLRLEKEKKIKIIKETGYKRYYISTEEIETKDKKILGLLRKDIPLKIVLFLANHKNARHKEILEYLDIAPSTLTYHLNKLIENNIIVVHRYGEEKGYSLKNEKELMAFVLKYRLHIVVDGFKDLWDGLNYKRW